MEAAEWFYVHDGHRVGPVQASVLKELASNGSLRPTDPVWRSGLSWSLPASHIKGLFQSDLPTPPPLPANQTPGDRHHFAVAGWLSIANAVMTLPLVALAMLLSELPGTWPKAVLALLEITTLVLFVYIFMTLKRLLNSRFDFRNADALITILVVTNLVFSLISLLLLGMPESQSAMIVLSILALVPLGIVYIAFSIQLLKLQGNLYGMLQPFAWSSIATGFCMGTVILAPLGLLAGAVSDIFLAIVFLRAAEADL